jgi:outer membrane lipoprotein SlyB
MSTKFIIAVALAVTMSGCAGFASVTGSHYTSKDGKLAIRGELIDSTDVRIFVNGEKVIDDKVSLLHGDGRFNGNYQGKPVSADCTTPAGRKLNATTCTVAVAGERVTLTL